MSVSILCMGLIFISYVVNYSSLMKSGKICQRASLVCTYKRGIRLMSPYRVECLFWMEGYTVRLERDFDGF